jgi:predicted amidophosphoribosyltransferase
MSMLVDPHICPDCRAPLDTAGTCTACGLRLRGPDAAALWEHMQQADRLITRLRATAVA